MPLKRHRLSQDSRESRCNRQRRFARLTAVRGRASSLTTSRRTPQYVAWIAGDDVPAGGSETRSQVGDRAVVAVRAAVEELDAGGLVVVASHGGTIRAVIGRMLDLPVDHWRVLGGLANCCWSVLEEGRTGWRLVEHNAGSLPQVVLGDDR